jgi:hypothetical protein
MIDFHSFEHWTVRATLPDLNSDIDLLAMIWYMNLENGNNYLKTNSWLILIRLSINQSEPLRLT